MALKDHPDADEIYNFVHAQDSRISKATVYRNLHVLADRGEITHVRIPGADRFDFNLAPHHHIVCTVCGAVCDAPADYAEELDKKVESATGFKIAGHSTVFEGVCPSCQQRLGGR